MISLGYCADVGGVNHYQPVNSNKTGGAASFTAVLSYSVKIRAWRVCPGEEKENIEVNLTLT